MGRRSLVRSHVSLALAFSTGKWYCEQCQGPNHSSVSLDVKHFKDYIQQNFKRWAVIERSLFQSRKNSYPHVKTVYYETLATISAMMSRVGASAKLNTRSLREVVRNYDEVCSELQVASLEETHKFD